VGFEPTNGGFAVLRSGTKLFIFLGDFVGLDRLTTLLLPDSVSRIVSKIRVYLVPPAKKEQAFFAWCRNHSLMCTGTQIVIVQYRNRQAGGIGDSARSRLRQRTAAGNCGQSSFVKPRRQHRWYTGTRPPIGLPTNCVRRRTGYAITADFGEITGINIRTAAKPITGLVTSLSYATTKRPFASQFQVNVPSPKEMFFQPYSCDAGHKRE
jgi:hypothetical protein